MNDLLDVLVRYGYLVVFGWVFAEQIGLPIPAMPVLLAAGAVAATGRLSLVSVLAMAAVASLMSDVIWYWIGRTGGGRVLGLLCRIWYAASHISNHARINTPSDLWTEAINIDFIDSIKMSIGITGQLLPGFNRLVEELALWSIRTPLDVGKRRLIGSNHASTRTGLNRHIAEGHTPFHRKITYR